MIFCAVIQTAVVGQITLRVADASASLAFYTDTLGMTLLSRQKVNRTIVTII